VERGAQGLYAWVVKPDSTVAVQPLKVGQIDNGTAEILDGIADGQQVVTAGQYRLEPGSRVAVSAAKPGQAGAQQAAATP
jgi:multidrug efflux system membrane fusion protein